jgi:hypothetical protein
MYPKINIGRKIVNDRRWWVHPREKAGKPKNAIRIHPPIAARAHARATKKRGGVPSTGFSVFFIVAVFVF